MRVLLIKTSSLGDVIHTLAAVTDAARARPDIRLDWVVEEAFAEIPSWHPAVTDVIPVAIRRWRKQLWQTWRSGQWRDFKQRLARRHYDLVIDAQGLLKSALLTRYPKAPVAGLDRHSAREPLASLFYQHRYPVAKNQHAVERTRQLLAQALDYPLPDSVADYSLNADFVSGEQPPYLLFLHGTTWPSKHWPEPYWRQLAQPLAAEGWALRLPWGNAEERARAERICAGLRHAQVLPRLDLRGIAGAIAGARACVAVDTGLGHLAAALDVPTLSLYGPTRPDRVGTHGRNQVHLCATGPRAGKGDRNAPCFDNLGAEPVLGALRALLSQSQSPSAGAAPLTGNS